MWDIPCMHKHLTLVLLLTAFPAVSLAALEESAVLEPVVIGDASAENSGNTPYEYTLEGRPDPFTPFITKKAATPKLDPNEIIDTQRELTGMQLFEPGQLKLVAVMISDSGKMAMVEDVTGKGYILKEGNLIGRRGVVTTIDRQGVLITETARTRAGKEIKSIVAMRLKTEGEQ